ncbi:MAG: HAD-IIIC family phosphatase [Clostridiales bacterium]
MKIIINATFTAEPLEDYINWWGKSFNIDFDLKFIQYDQVFQELINDNSETSTNQNGANLFLVQFEDFIRYDKSSDEVKINKIKRNYNELLEILYTKKKNVPYYFCILPINTEQKMGIKLRSYLDELNESWKKSLTNMEDIFVIDVTKAKELYSVEKVFDLVKNNIGHIPYTEEYFSVLGTQIFRNLYLANQQIFKVIVVDCDNTLWKGIAGEDGVNNLKITKGHRFLHEFLIQKYDEGMLLAICSKNNENDVWEVFDKNKEMLLKREHFVTWKINWDSKATNIREIGAELNLGLDSFIFIDDSSAECFNVMTELPEVLTLCIPEDAAYLEKYIKHVWAFDKHRNYSKEKNRSKMYITEKQRKSMRKESISLEEYLKALNLKASMNVITESQIPRISQLSQRTNQFNSTAIRRTEKEVKSLIENDYIIWAIEVSDNFGDYGLVGGIFTYIENTCLIIDSFLLSCRTLSRSIEDVILYGINKYCLDNNIESIIIKYCKTQKNQPFTDFIKKSNFLIFDNDEEFILYEKKVNPYLEEISFVEFYYKSNYEKKLNIEIIGKEYHFEHVGVIVDDINEEADLYKKLGYRVTDIIYDEFQNVYLAMCTKNGYISIELIGIYNNESPIKRILERSGKGPYHLCYTVEKIEDFLVDIKAHNIEYEIVSDQKPAVLFGYKKVLFLHIKNVGLIELLEIKKENLEKNDLYYNNVIRVITGDLNQAAHFYKILGYKEFKVSKEPENSIISMVMEKKYEKIEFVMPISNNIEKSNLLRNFGAHPYQIFSEIKSIDDFKDYYEQFEKIKLEALEQKHIFGYLKEETKSLTSIKNMSYYNIYEKSNDYRSTDKAYLWDVKFVNYDNLKHKNHYLYLKYHTAKALHSLPIYEVINNKAKFSEYVAPRNEAEEKMFNYWKKVLRIDKFGVNDNFFALGGNSLAAVDVIANAIVEFDIKLDDIFKYETISNIISNVKFNTDTIKNTLKKFNDLALSTKNKQLEDKILDLNINENLEKYNNEVLEITNQNIDYLSNYNDLLLLGSTGYYGIHILNELVNNTNYDIHLLIRGKDISDCQDRINLRYNFYFNENLIPKYKDRVHIYQGNASEKDFNMRQNDYRMLKEKIDCVINSAANVKHFGKYNEFDKSNIQITNRIIEFSTKGKVKDIHQISTINVAQGKIDGVKNILFTELDNHFGQKEENFYIKSKLEAENILINLRDKGLNCNIYRAGNLAISYNSKAQINSQENAYISLINSIINMGIVPEISYKNMDLTYVDYASNAFIKLFDKKGILNRNFHLYNPNKIGFVDIGEVLNEMGKNIHIVEMEYFLKKLEEKSKTHMQDVINFIMHASYILGEEEYTNFIIQNKMTIGILKRLNFQWEDNTKEYINKIVKL